MDVETLVHDPESPEAGQTPGAGAPGGSGETPPVEHACPHCGAALAPGQEWCLECGEAVGSGGMPGWRTGVAVLAIALALASGAVAAAYAAMRGDGSAPSTVAQVTQGPAATSGTPDLGAAPAEGTGSGAAPAQGGAPSAATPPPAAPPAATPPAATPPAATPPAATPPPATPPASAPAPAPSAPSGGSNGSGGNGGGGGGKGEQNAPYVKPKAYVAVTLDPSAASVFPASAATPPAGAPGDGSTTTTPGSTTTTPGSTTTTPGSTQAPSDPKQALDGDPATAWSVPLTGDQVATPNVGLLVDLGALKGVRRLQVTPTTPGTTIEVLGTRKTQAPASVDDKAWTPLATQLDVKGKTNIALGDGSDKVRQVLVLFTEGPVDGTPSVGFSELKLFT